MSKYQYPYQKIVDLKSSEKTQAEWLLSTAIGKLQEEERCLEQLEGEVVVWQDKLQAAASDVIPLSELRTIQSYLDYLESCISSKLNDIDAAKQHVLQQQGRLTSKMKDEKVWLKAKEHASHRFLHALQVKQQNELDEMATVRFQMSAQ